MTSRRSLRRWPRLGAAATAAAALAAALALAGAGPAAAHAVLVDTTPADGSVLTDPPAEIAVRFNEPISLAAQGTALLDAEGTEVDAAITAVDAQVTMVPAAPLGDGTYVVTWRVVSADTHPVAGGITFSVGAPSGAVVGVPTGGDGPLNLVREIVDALRYAGVLGAVGLVWFALLIAGPARRRSVTLARRLRWAGSGFAGLAVAAAVLLVPLTALWQNGDGPGALLRAALWGQAFTGPAAVAAVLIAAGFGVAVLAARRSWPVLGSAGAAAALGALLLEGHTRTFGPSWLVLTADLVHVAAAALWFGGLIGLALVLADGGTRPEWAARTVGAFSTAAMGTVAALGVSAFALWWRLSGSVSGLWHSHFGRLVLFKLLIVGVVVLVAAWNRFTLVPAVVAEARRPDRAAGARTRLRRATAVEAFALVAVIGVTAVLVTKNPERPPAVPAAESTAQITASARADGVVADLAVSPGERGINVLGLRLSDEDGGVLETFEGQPPELAVTLSGTTIGPFRHTLVATGPGEFEATVDLPLPGTWSVSLTVRLDKFTSPVLTTEVEIE